MLRRAFATADVLSVHPTGLAPRLAPTIVRAAHRAVFHYEPQPGMLYVRSRAISSRCNDNYDYFPAEEIKAAYRTFIGKPVFVNHHNDDHKRMRGLILDAALHEDRNPDGSPDTWAEVLMEVDGWRYPKLARALIRGDIDRTSMGCDVETSTCSACGNVATMPSQYCAHIPGRKGNRITQALADGRSELKLIYEECRGLAFFENSLLVEPPADPTAFRTHPVELGPGLEHLARTAGLRPVASTCSPIQLDKPVEILPDQDRPRVLSHSAVLVSENSRVWRLLAEANSAPGPDQDLNGEVWRLLHHGGAGKDEPGQSSEFLKNYPSDSEIDELREGGFGGGEPWRPYRHELESRPEPRVGLPQQVKGEFKGPDVGTVYSRVPHGTKGAMNAPSPREEYHGPYEVMRHAQTGKYHVVDNQDRVTDYGNRDGMDDRFQAEHIRDYAEHKQRSKEIARGIADKLWSGFQEAMDPGGTEESRESERNVHSMNNLQNLGYQPHHIKFDDEDGGQPHAEIEHTLPDGKKTGWFGVDHGGSGYLEIKHRATGDESHDVINLSQHENGQDFRKPGYGPAEAHADLHHWHSGPEEETGGTRQYLEQNDPRIRRWKQRHGVRRRSAYIEPPWLQLVRTAYGEIKSPPDVDTLRDEACPICGNDSAYAGRECQICFAPETLVRTEVGYVPIASIQVGDRVLSSNGQFNRVLEVIERDYDGLAYRLRTSMMSSPILVTPEHPIAAVVAHHARTDKCRKGRCFPKQPVARSRMGSVNHHLGWVEARNIALDTFTVTQTPDESATIDLDHVNLPEWVTGRVRSDGSRMRRGEMSIELTDDMLWAIGLYLAEGSAGNRQITYSLHVKEIDYIARLVSLFEGLGYSTAVVSGQSENGVAVNIHSTTLAEWFPVWLGSGSHNKAIPSELLNLPMSKLVHIWQGVLDGDGTNGVDQLKQTSEILALQMVEIALRRGGVPTLNTHQKVDRKRTWSVIGTTRSRMGRRDGGHKRGTLRWNDRVFAQAYRNEQTVYAGKVYNLRVETDPTYVVQNLLVHNCGYILPIKPFADPDVDKARQLDQLRQTVDDELLAADPSRNGAPFDDPAAVDPDSQQPLFGCPNCGETVEPEPPQTTDAPGVAAEQGPAAGDPCPNCGEGELQPVEPPVEDDEEADPDPDELDQDRDQLPDDEENKTEKKSKNPASAKDKTSKLRTSRTDEGDPRAMTTNPGLQALAAQQQLIERLQATAQTQQDLIQRLYAQNGRQSTQIQRLTAAVTTLAQLGGPDTLGRVKVAMIRKKADEQNPAQPIPEPAPQPPTQTTPQAKTPEAFADVTAPGMVPGSTQDVAADAVTTTYTPGQDIAAAPFHNLVDVTAPVDGTQGPRPINEVRTETDVRVGNPMNPQVAYPIGGPFAQTQRTIGSRQPAMTQPSSNERFTACVRLARLQIQAGLAQGEDLALAQRYARDVDNMPDVVIAANIETLSQLQSTAAARVLAQPPRSLVPRTAAGVGGVQRTLPPMPLMTQASQIGVADNSDDDLAFIGLDLD